jgi:Kef-type K+ transport system membrane component KefB
MLEIFEKFAIELPVTNPVLIFSLVLFVILFAPLILNRFKIPHIIGLILAGVALGEKGFGILSRDESFELFGSVGLLYIMFLAGLQMDLSDFKKNVSKSIFFGFVTFIIPITLGVVSSYFMLQYNFEQILNLEYVTYNGNLNLNQYIILASILIASMYSSHTLIAYPIVGRYGVTKNSSVSITIGGTMIATTLSLVILAIIVMICKGENSVSFWIEFIISITLFAIVIGVVFPWIAEHFLKKYDDSILQYIFVLALTFLGGFLSELAGLESIIGAFMVGLSLNRYIPKISPLMNRLDFVGNALFIPFFLIGVGMLIDVRAIFSGIDTLVVALIMCLTATLTKYIAAVFTRKTFKMSKEEGLMIFGLSNAHAAACLAAVMIGYNLPIGTMQDGTTLYLLGDEILNATIVMVLVSCTISSLATEKAARKIVIKQDQLDEKLTEEKLADRILIPIYNPDTLNSLMELAVLLKVDKSKEPLYALNVANDINGNTLDKGKKLLEKAAKIASATDNNLRMITRYDVNVTSGILHTMKENYITEVVMGLHQKSHFSDSFFGDKADNLLKSTNQMIYSHNHFLKNNQNKELLITQS